MAMRNHALGANTMTTITIYNTPHFILTSYGNGAMYKFNNKRAHRSLFVQGDDASIFRADLETHTEIRGDIDDALNNLWCDYSDVSIPD